MASNVVEVTCRDIPEVGQQIRRMQSLIGLFLEATECPSCGAQVLAGYTQTTRDRWKTYVDVGTYKAHPPYECGPFLHRLEVAKINGKTCPCNDIRDDIMDWIIDTRRVGWIIKTSDPVRESWSCDYCHRIVRTRVQSGGLGT